MFASIDLSLFFALIVCFSSEYLAFDRWNSLSIEFHRWFSILKLIHSFHLHLRHLCSIHPFFLLRLVNQSNRSFYFVTRAKTSTFLFYIDFLFSPILDILKFSTWAAPWHGLPNALITQFLVSLNKLTNCRSLHENGNGSSVSSPASCNGIYCFFIENSQKKTSYSFVLLFLSCHRNFRSFLLKSMNQKREKRSTQKNIVALINRFFSKFRLTMQKKVKIALAKRTKPITKSKQKQLLVAQKNHSIASELGEIWTFKQRNQLNRFVRELICCAWCESRVFPLVFVSKRIAHERDGTKMTLFDQYISDDQVFVLENGCTGWNCVIN